MNYDLVISIDGEAKRYLLPTQRDRLSGTIKMLTHELSWEIQNKLLVKLVKDGRMTYASCNIEIECEKSETSLKVGVSKTAPCGVENDLTEKVNTCIRQITKQICSDIIFSEKFNQY